MTTRAAPLKALIMYFSLSISSVNAQDTSVPIDSFVQECISLTISQKYDSAEAICKKIQTIDKHNPIGYLLLAATIQSKMMDYETDRWENAFHENIDKTIALCRHRLSQNRLDAWSHFCLGSAFCYKSFYLGKQHHLFQSLKFATRGIKELNQAVKLDSTMYDAYFAIGTYKYWKSRKIQFLTWLPFIKDERKTGIMMIQRTIEQGKFSKYAALNGLSWIYLDAGRIEDAISAAMSGLRDFPGSRFFLWCVADSYFKKQDYENAQVYYQKILDSILTEPHNNHYNEILSRQKLAACFHFMGHYEASINQCDIISSLSLDDKIIKRAQKHLENIEKIREANENALKHSLAN